MWKGLSDILETARKAPGSDWPYSKMQMLAGFGEIFQKFSGDGSSSQIILNDIGHTLEKARATSDSEFKFRQILFVSRLHDCMEFVLRSRMTAVSKSCQTPPERWQGTKEEILATFADAMRMDNPTDPSAVERALRKIDALLEMFRAGDIPGTYVGGGELRDMCQMLHREIALGSGMPRVKPPFMRMLARIVPFFVILIISGLLVLKYLVRRGASLKELFPPIFRVATAAIWTTLLKLNKRRSFRALKYCVWLIVFFEISSRVIVSIDPLFFRIRGRIDKASWRIHFVKLHSREKEINLAQFQQGQEGTMAHHPTRGWTMAPNLKDFPAFVGKTLNSNSKGIRGSVEYGYEKPRGKVRIIVLGNSYTYGDEVNDDETYPHHLQEILPEAEVLNFGMVGYGHDQMLQYLKEEGVKYHPDIVILGFLGIDMWKNTTDFTYRPKPVFRLVDGKLELRGVPVPRPELVLAREAYRLKVLDLLSILYYKHRSATDIEQETSQITTAILDEMIATIRRAGATPVFTYLPFDRELEEHLGGYKQFFNQFCTSRGILCVSVTEALRAGMELGAVRRIQRAPRHWISSESAVVAQRIKRFLVENGLITRIPERHRAHQSAP